MKPVLNEPLGLHIRRRGHDDTEFGLSAKNSDDF